MRKYQLNMNVESHSLHVRRSRTIVHRDGRTRVLASRASVASLRFSALSRLGTPTRGVRLRVGLGRCRISRIAHVYLGPNFSRLSPLGHILWTSSSIALRLFTLFEWIWSTGLFGLFGRLMHTSSYGIVWHFRSSYRAISSSGISNGITAAAISCLLVRR